MRSLRSQLVVSHLILVLLMAMVMGTAIYTFFGISRSVEQILQENFETMLSAQQIDSALHQQATAFAVFEGGDPVTALSDYREARVEFDRALLQATRIATEPNEQALLTEITRDAEAVNQISARILTPDGQILTRSQRTEVLDDEIRPRLLDMRIHARELFNLNAEEVKQASRMAQASAERAAWRSLFVTAGTIFVAVLLGLRMVQRALNPLANLAQRAERIASGIFQPSEDSDRADEVGALARSFHVMEDNLAAMRRKEVRRLQRAEQMSDAAIDSLYDPVIVTDAQRRIVHLNRAAEGLFGSVKPGSRVPIDSQVPDRRIVKAIDAAIEDRVSAAEDEAAMIVVRVGETERTYRIRTSPMTDDEQNVLGSVTVLEDITHLRVVDRIKTEFIGVASHELRTPVTSLLLANQLLLEGAAGEINESQREVLQTQQEDLNRLRKMMQDLLDVTRLEAGSSPPRFELVTPAELVGPPMGTLGPQAADKGVRLVVDVPSDLPRVRADRGQVGRVLTNLVANAIRHTKPGGQVTVSASDIENVVSFRVEDTGEGIPKDYLDKIFDRFVQVPGATQGGAGLGLSIAQNIVRAHGGHMSVSSEVGVGSTFGFTLPTDAASSSEGKSV